MNIFLFAICLVLVGCVGAGWFILRTGDAYAKTQAQDHDNGDAE